MNIPKPILFGFFPKKVALRTDWFKNPTVLDICSVSNCISKGPENWVDKWKHNTTTWLFDTPEAARSILDQDISDFNIFAYQLFPVLFDGDVTQLFEVVSSADGDLANFKLLGYDIVSRSGGSNFECSPLSCNNGCETIAVNEHCLIDDLDAAWSTAKQIAMESKAAGSWEPGPYCLLKVFIERIGEQ
jgi:hypothetical protein